MQNEHAGILLSYYRFEITKLHIRHIILMMSSLNPSLRSKSRKISKATGEENNGNVHSFARQGNDGGGSTHISASRIISANRRKINKRNITSAAGSTELGTGHGIGWGKRDGNGARKRC